MQIASTLLVCLITVGQSGEVVLLDFTAQGCTPCRQMEPVIERLVEEGYPVRRIDVDRFRRLADQWNVRSVPCYVVVRDGQEVERVVGPASFDRLVRMLDHAGFHHSGVTIRGQNPAPTVASSVLSVGEQLRSTLSRASPAGPGSRSTAAATAVAYHEPLSEGERRAAGASVRIRVEDPDGQSVGTGTIIHSLDHEALVLTCGHLFRQSQGRLSIAVDLFLPDGEQTVTGRLLRYDAEERDLALLTIAVPYRIPAVSLASDESTLQPGSSVFSWGCDHGGPLRLMRSRVNSIDRYVGRSRYIHTIQVSGDPVDGRSGGGLFDSQGRLLGVCYAADPSEVEEGLYMGVKTIRQLLDELQLSFVYEARPDHSPVSAAAAPVAAGPKPATAPPSVSAHASASQLVSLAPEQTLSRGAADTTAESSSSVAIGADGRHTPIERLLQMLESSQEVLLIARQGTNGQAELLVLDDELRVHVARQLRNQQR